MIDWLDDNFGQLVTDMEANPFSKRTASFRMRESHRKEETQIPLGMIMRRESLSRSSSFRRALSGRESSRSQTWSRKVAEAVLAIRKYMWIHEDKAEHRSSSCRIFVPAWVKQEFQHTLSAASDWFSLAIKKEMELLVYSQTIEIWRAINSRIN